MKDILKTLQAARGGQVEEISSDRAQEIIDSYFFGKSNRTTKKLIRGARAENRKRRETNENFANR